MLPEEKSAPPTRGTSSAARKIVWLLAATGLALSPVLLADFIRLDDQVHLLENAQLRKVSLSGLAAFWTKPYFGLYIPVTYTVWWGLAVLGGLFGELEKQAWLFHAFNLALHLANAVLVFATVRVLLRRGRPEAPPPGDGAGESADRDDEIALIAALFFALHPVQVESVAWVSEMKGELAALFGLLGVWWWHRSRARLPSVGVFVAFFVAFLVAAMLSKPTALVFLAIPFLIDRILFARTWKESARAPLLAGVPLLALTFVTMHAQPDSDQDFIATVWQRPIVAADAVAFYVFKALVPFPLALDYGRTPRAVLDHASRGGLAGSALLSLVGVGAVVWALLRPPAPGPARRGQALVLGGWAIFVVSMAPVLGLIPFEFQSVSTVADRYLYVPLFGASLLVAGLLVRLGAAGRPRRIAAAPLLVYAALGFHQAGLWRSTESLFTHTVAVNPSSYLGPFCIGDDLMRTGRLAEAVDWLRRSVSSNPDYLSAALNLGAALTRQGEPDAAIEVYESQLARNPSTTGARASGVAALHNNLALLLAQSGQEDAGVAHLRKAVEIFPGALNAHLNLGNYALENHRYADAIAEFETALSLSPGNPTIAERLALARQGAAQP